jgi:uncharacterized protein YndB with AHSA1/START domain
MLKKIIGLLALTIALFMGYVALQSPHYVISREITINASPELLFPYINNSKRANTWMPWQEVDPGVVMSFAGPNEGVGSTSSWNSDGQMGTGKAEVVESIPNSLVKTKLSYEQPMVMSQMAEISLTTTPPGTRVRWSVTGENTFIGRLFCFFMNMDKMVGGQFEKGLTKLKQLAEGEAAKSVS